MQILEACLEAAGAAGVVHLALHCDQHGLITSWQTRLKAYIDPGCQPAVNISDKSSAACFGVCCHSSMQRLNGHSNDNSHNRHHHRRRRHHHHHRHHHHNNNNDNDSMHNHHHHHNNNNNSNNNNNDSIHNRHHLNNNNNNNK